MFLMGARYGFNDSMLKFNVETKLILSGVGPYLTQYLSKGLELKDRGRIYFVYIVCLSGTLCYRSCEHCIYPIQGIIAKTALCI